jgi:hypothetical protein
VAWFFFEDIDKKFTSRRSSLALLHFLCRVFLVMAREENGAIWL